MNTKQEFTVEYTEKLMKDLSNEIIEMALDLKILKSENERLKRKIAYYQEIAPYVDYHDEDKAVSKIERRLERIK